MKNKIEIIPFVKDDLRGATILDMPQSALSSIPNWHREQPGKFDDSFLDLSRPRGEEEPKNRSGNLTVKRCMPFFDAMTQDFVVKTNVTVGVSRMPNMRQAIHMLRDKPGQTLLNEEIGFHGRLQWEHFPASEDYDQETAYKWINRYGIKTPKGYSIVFHHPHNRPDLPFYTFSGTVDTDRYTKPVNFPFLLKKDFIGIIPKGTPVVQFSIVKRQKWEKFVQEFDMKNIDNANEEFLYSFDNHYKTNYRDSRKYA